MMSESDIRFHEKKVDESWKTQVTSEKNQTGSPGKTEPNPTAQPADSESSFSSYISSIAIQALICLGDIENPATGKKEKDLSMAKQFIDLLVMFKEKTKGNRTSAEEKLMISAVTDLQMKFVDTSQP